LSYPSVEFSLLGPGKLHPALGEFDGSARARTAGTDHEH
jgi:hypothetical protein